jgi:hypothetical protein
MAPSVDCVIRNYSQDGCCIEVSSPETIPDRFKLLIKPELLKRSCKVVWRDVDKLGVTFVT